MEWAYRAGQRRQGRRRPHHQDRAAEPQHRRADREPRRVRRLAHRGQPRRSPTAAATRTRQDDTAYLVAGTRRPVASTDARTAGCPTTPNDAQCLTSAGMAETGVDPNRNYGGLWGGPGADRRTPATQTYRAGARSPSPRPRTSRTLVGTRNIMTLITNHTTAGLVLRAPGIAALGDPVDENRGYKALGDAMALENGYFSQKSFELYDTTGTTEDWTYNTAGGFGFTFEIYCGEAQLRDGRLRRPRLPPALPAGGRGVQRHLAAGRPQGRPGSQRRLPLRQRQGLRREGQLARPTRWPRRARSTSRATRSSPGRRRRARRCA